MPLDFIPAPRRVRLLWIFIAFNLGFYAVFLWLDQPLRTPAAPAGIVSYELAASPLAAQAMLASWNETARVSAAFGLGFDFLFMPSYAIALSLAVMIAAGRRRGRFWAVAGKTLSWGAFAAVGFDAVENIALFFILLYGAAPPLPELAFVCAVIKFLILLLGVFYALTGWLFSQ